MLMWAGQSDCSDLGANVVSACGSFESALQSFASQNQNPDNATITQGIKSSNTKVSSR